MSDAVPPEVPGDRTPTSPMTMALALGALLLVVLVVVIAINFAVVRHWSCVHSGTCAAGDVWYNFWSGFGSDLGEATLVTAVIAGVWTGVRKSNCHVKGCWRIGHFPLEHTPYHLCQKHHPSVPDEALTHGKILERHRILKADYEARNPRRDTATTPPG